MSATDDEITETIMTLCKRRRPEATICPSEAARAVAPADWRPLMDDVRRVALRLAAEGRIEVRQSGEAVDPETARGPIRLALAR